MPLVQHLMPVYAEEPHLPAAALPEPASHQKPSSKKSAAKVKKGKPQADAVEENQSTTIPTALLPPTVSLNRSEEDDHRIAELLNKFIVHKLCSYCCSRRQQGTSLSCGDNTPKHNTTHPPHMATTATTFNMLRDQVIYHYPPTPVDGAEGGICNDSVNYFGVKFGLTRGALTNRCVESSLHDRLISIDLQSVQRRCAPLVLGPFKPPHSGIYNSGRFIRLSDHEGADAIPSYLHDAEASAAGIQGCARPAHHGVILAETALSLDTVLLLGCGKAYPTMNATTGAIIGIDERDLLLPDAAEAVNVTTPSADHEAALLQRNPLAWAFILEPFVIAQPVSGGGEATDDWCLVAYPNLETAMFDPDFYDGADAEELEDDGTTAVREANLQPDEKKQSDPIARNLRFLIPKSLLWRNTATFMGELCIGPQYYAQCSAVCSNLVDALGTLTCPLYSNDEPLLNSYTPPPPPIVQSLSSKSSFVAGTSLFTNGLSLSKAGVAPGFRPLIVKPRVAIRQPQSEPTTHCQPVLEPQLKQDVQPQSLMARQIPKQASRPAEELESMQSLPLDFETTPSATTAFSCPPGPELHLPKSSATEVPPEHVTTEFPDMLAKKEEKPKRVRQAKKVVEPLQEVSAEGDTVAQQSMKPKAPRKSRMKKAVQTDGDEDISGAAHPTPALPAPKRPRKRAREEPAFNAHGTEAATDLPVTSTPTTFNGQSETASPQTVDTPAIA